MNYTILSIREFINKRESVTCFLKSFGLKYKALLSVLLEWQS